jgi:hypothetical protein
MSPLCVDLSVGVRYYHLVNHGHSTCHTHATSVIRASSSDTMFRSRNARLQKFGSQTCRSTTSTSALLASRSRCVHSACVRSPSTSAKQQLRLLLSLRRHLRVSHKPKLLLKQQHKAHRFPAHQTFASADVF